MSTNRAQRRAAARTPAEARYGPARGGRIALVPAVIAAVALLAGLGLTSSGGYLAIRFIVAILAAIVGVFALQGRALWWLLPLGAIVVIWNPVIPIALDGPVWTIVQVVASAVLVVAGIGIRRPS